MRKDRDQVQLRAAGARDDGALPGVQQHLLTFEQEWTDKSDGRTLPRFVTDELHDFLGCGILARELAQLFCPTCH